MSNLVKLEEAGLFIFGLFLFSLLDFAWWWFPALLLVPDLSMIGYVFGNKAGAWTYNIAHHRAIALLLCMLGFYISDTTVLLAGVILFSHSSMDRMFGYGLKYERGFKFTHLGDIGKKN